MAHTDVIPTSASVASTGKGIRYIGNRAFCFSGENQINTSAVEALSFTSGSGYIVGSFVFGGAIKYSDIGNGTINAWQVSFNDLVVALVKVATNTDDQPAMVTYDIIIPPQTRVKVEVKDSASTSAGFFTTTTFTGRVYGAA